MLRAMIVTAAVLLVGGVAAPKAQAQYPKYYNNQWYSKGSGASKYYYAHYYYAPNKYHHAYYYPSKSKRYVYYYNWEKKRYWGRYDLETQKYSLLSEDKRKENLDDIAEGDFPEPVALDKVTIPGSTDTMTAPPKLPE
ncbi:MAG: hypothetical protein SNJ82_07600 [Gemmataceae bacterium]